MEWFRVFLVVSFCLGFSQITWAQANLDRDLSQAHKELRADPTYQFEFIKPPKPPKTMQRPKWLDSIAKLFTWLVEVLRFVFMVGLVVLIGGFLWVVLREISKTNFKKITKTKTDDEPAVQMPKPEEKMAKISLEEADSLAAQGQFGEAAHLLLFRAIFEIEKHIPGAVRRSQTSREIEVLSAIPDHPRSGFEHIRQAVEQSFFGKQVMEKQQFTTCRAAYEDFAFSKEWS